MASYSILLMVHFTYITASNPIFRNFEKTFSGQVIDPCDLTIKEQIGEGEFVYISLIISFICHLVNPCNYFAMITSTVHNI